MYNMLLEQISSMFESMDSVMITNINGDIEYSAILDKTKGKIVNAGYTGNNILNIYPGLTKKTSTHFIAMKTGEPQLNIIQNIIDWQGQEITILSNTYPIITDDKIIGAIEGMDFISINGKEYTNHKKTTGKYTKENLYVLDDIITVDDDMIALKEKVRRVATSDSAVMIVGETGTGKELFAQAVHSHSDRANKPFISQNCAAIPSGLLESIIFGTVKGSYTGAEDKKGLLELAHGGTLFLDEINSMDIYLQGKILKVLEDGEVRRVGDTKTTKIDVRIVSAMNENPKDVIKDGRMRADLYYRLGVIMFKIPGLKNRKGDVQALINYFIDTFNKKYNRHITGMSDIVKEVINKYTWPGNVRELRNVIEYAFNISEDDIIQLSDIPEFLLSDEPSCAHERGLDYMWKDMLKMGNSLGDVVNEFEKSLILDAYSENKTITETARALNISRQALNYKMEKYRIK